MPQSTDDLLTFRALHKSPIVSVRDYLCRAGRGGPGAEEHSDSCTIVLLRHGVFCKHFGRWSIAADVNQAVFFSAGSTYGVSHPDDCGDRGTVFAPAPCVLADIVRELSPRAEDGPAGQLPFVTEPCDTEVYWRHRELVCRLESIDEVPIVPLWADVTALQLVADVLEAAYSRYGRPRRGRRSTDVDHADRTEAVKTLLAARLGERITHDEVARAVHASPYHIARVFQQLTGVPIHRYLTRLRLRASLERLSAGADDLTSLAFDLGFSSHAHFSDAFRREFGRTPSVVRQNLARRSLRELSKKLEV